MALDDTARARAEAVAAAIKNRGRTEHHTREVRQELPDDIRDLVIENSQVATKQTIEIAELKSQLASLGTRVASLERLISELAHEARRAVA